MANRVMTIKGEDFAIINLTLTTTGTEIDPSASPDRRANAFIIQALDAEDIELTRELNGTEFFTIKSGTVLHFDLKATKEQPFFLRAAADTTDVEIIYLF